MNQIKPIPPTSTADMDSALKTLRGNADRFLKLTVQDRIQLLQEMSAGYARVADESVRMACVAKGLDYNSAVSGEEWLGGPALVVRNIRLLIRSLQQIARTGTVALPQVKTLPNGQVAVRAFPSDTYDKLMFNGFDAWVWQDPGVTEANLPDTVAWYYKNLPKKGEVSLILGAGNVASIAPMDALYKMFTELKVCIIKMNPVNEYLGPFIERAFKSVIDQGYLKVVYGAGDVGKYLVNHPEVDEVHITGSDETHDMIVWGPPGPDRDRRRQENDPLLKKPITSELGNVSPVVIVPAQFSEKELAFQAENVASMLTNNAGFNCNAAKVLVTSAAWPQRDTFLKLLGEKLDSIPARKAYYPGARDRHSRFVQGHDHVQQFGHPGADELPWALIRDLDSSNKNEICFSKEAFCSILGETTLKPGDAVAFLAEAVTFCNETTWGTLNCTFIIHPSVESTPAGKKAVEDAIRDLRFGAVTINHWAALGYGFVSTPWGGHSGTTLRDVQSGRGWVHNTFMLEKAQKTVIRGPLVVAPKPPWFRTNKNTHNIGRKLLEFESGPGPLKLMGVVMQSMKG